MNEIKTNNERACDLLWRRPLGEGGPVHIQNILTGQEQINLVINALDDAEKRGRETSWGMSLNTAHKENIKECIEALLKGTDQYSSRVDCVQVLIEFLNMTDEKNG